MIENLKFEINSYLDSVPEISSCEVVITSLNIRLNKVNGTRLNIDEMSAHYSRADNQVHENNALLIESGLKLSHVTAILIKLEDLFGIVMPDQSVFTKGFFGVYKEFMDIIKKNGEINYLYTKDKK